MIDNIPWWFAVPLAAVLWFIVLTKMFEVHDRIDRYFHRRRMLRRMKMLSKNGVVGRPDVEKVFSYATTSRRR